MAETVCDMIPIVKPATNSSPLPELVYFIHKLTVRSHMDCQVAIIALIYLHRCKRVLPKGAVGNPDTAHRMILASVLIASKFVQDSSLTTFPCLTNQKLCRLCDGMYTLRDIGDLERAFLKILKYRCWVSHDDIQRFLYKHRADLLL
ncbi:cyclin domain-containing protein [Umbelopsis sp. PMI_123]|nr:cyclin domain-containing protein [Umbelopsis sp. PMI_123]